MKHQQLWKRDRRGFYLGVCMLLLGSIVSLTFAQNQQTLLFTTVRTGDTEVFTIDPQTGDCLNVSKAPKSEERYPSWSPDGKRVVFTSNREDGKTYNLYIANADGSALRRLTNLPAGSVAYWASWPTDGKMVYFNEGNSSKICRIRPDGTGFEEVATGRDGNVSPDGKSLVFTQRGTKGFGVWVMDVDGKNPRQVVNHESEIGGIAPAWSPDGRWIAFSGQDRDYAEIFVCSADGKTLKQVTKLEKISSSPAWSPDGKQLTFRVTDFAYWREQKAMKKAYEDKAPDKRPVYVVNADGTDPHVIEVLHYQCAIDGSRAEWKPGGKY